MSRHGSVERMTKTMYLDNMRECVGTEWGSMCGGMIWFKNLEILWTCGITGKLHRPFCCISEDTHDYK